MKDIKDVCFVIQSRVNSERVPKKVIKDFAGTTLVDIALNKLVNSSVIPNNQIYFSVHDKELIDIGKKYPINIFNRSYESANCDTGLTTLFEWHDKLPFKYVVLLSACNPLLSIETIDNFIEHFINSNKEGGFGVIEKKQYFWDHKGNMISEWPEKQKIMNTKTMSITYEAAHCLYASRMDVIGDGYWMDDKSPPEPELFVIDEFETFDIDYEWQFKIGEMLYEKIS